MIENLTLRAGTKYYLEDGTGGISGPWPLEEDTPVNLLSSGTAWRVYERPGNPSWLYVRPEDDAPAPEATAPTP